MASSIQLAAVVRSARPLVYQRSPSLFPDLTLLAKIQTQIWGGHTVVLIVFEPVALESDATGCRPVLINAGSWANHSFTP